ncbi:MAG TPA: hypothetical protein VF534_23255 [Paraburkholderia sp.]
MIDLSAFVEAHVTGITFTEDDKGVSIFFRGQAKQRFTLVAEGVDRFVADEFREQNIVDRVHLWDSASEPNDYRDSLALLLSGVGGEQRNEAVWLPVIERAVIAIERGEKVFVEIEPVYGGWIVLLARSVAVSR